MADLVHALENENSNLEFYLDQINALNDLEIVSLFKNKKISYNMKDKLLIIVFDRINRLSTNSFIEVSKFAENISAYKKNYFSKIEEMNYQDFVNLIYNGIYEPSILLEITKTNTYKKYLQQEKEEQKEWHLQCFDIQVQLDSFTSMDDLNSIGKEMFSIICRVSQDDENIETMEYVYLRTLIENMDFLDLESDAIKIGLALMCRQMKQKQILTDKMVEFYLYYRVKELNLNDYCKHILISTEDSDIFGFFTMEGNGLKGGTLKIFSRYILNFYAKLKKVCDEKLLNTLINFNYIFALSHELLHNIKNQKYLKSTEKLDGKQYLEKMYTHKELNYYLRGAVLQQKISYEEYDKHHNIFIEEVQADIFAIFDSNRQFLTNFKDSLSQTQLEAWVSIQAKRLVDFYTNKDGTILSPMEKFDIFYLENIGSKKEPIVHDENPDIMDALMTGDKIPYDVYQFLQKIANEEIKTTDLYQTLADYINNRNIQSKNNLQMEDENVNIHL